MDDINQTSKQNNRIHLFAVLVAGICIGLIVAVVLIPDQPDKIFIPINKDEVNEELPAIQA